jgi:hypothetical protein
MTVDGFYSVVKKPGQEKEVTVSKTDVIPSIAAFERKRQSQEGTLPFTKEVESMMKGG